VDIPVPCAELAGVAVPETVQTILRLVAALGTLALCWQSRRRHDAVRSAAYVFALSVAYLMLFSPRTENNTYAMLGPAIAVFSLGRISLSSGPGGPRACRHRVGHRRGR